MEEETKRLLAKAMYKVRELRRQNEILGAKVEAMEMCSALLFARPCERTQGAELDVAWEIERHLDKVT